MNEQVCCESPSTVTLFLVENFGEFFLDKENKLKNIIYDISCQLEKYISNR
jgi:hypothetical protein